MNRRRFLGYGCMLSLLGATGGCLSKQLEGWGTRPHTETITVYNHRNERTTVSLDVRQSGKNAFLGRREVFASASWGVPEEFGAGAYELSIEVSGGRSATNSWDVPEKGPDGGLGIEMGSRASK